MSKTGDSENFFEKMIFLDYWEINLFLKKKSYSITRTSSLGLKRNTTETNFLLYLKRLTG